MYLANLDGQANFNIQLIGHVQYPDSEFSDIWGFTGQDGREYAIIGATGGTLIYDLSDPAHPEEVQFIPGANSIWRDFKSYGSYVYGIADQGKDGLLIIDMSGAPSAITWTFWNENIQVRDDQGAIVREGTLDHCHNLFIDEHGVLYLADCANVYRGNIILDITTNPGSAAFVNVFNTSISHDIIVRKDTAYSSDIFSGFFSVWDLSDKQHPLLIATQPTTSEFTHNAWISDDGHYLFTTDERAEAYVDAYDVTNVHDIRFLDKYRPPNARIKQVIPHNVHYKDGYLVVSYYTDGLKIIDAHRPDLLVEVGSYDTYPGDDGGYHGDWGAYPWLPSGLILVSDIESGLYILKPDYRRAYYIEGHITDAMTGDFLNDVQITISGDRLDQQVTDASGKYRLGYPEGDTLSVEYYRPGYEIVQRKLIGEPGTTLLVNIALVPKQQTVSRIQIVAAQTQEGIAGATVLYQDRALVETVLSGENGLTEITLPVGHYEIVAGKWGNITRHIQLEITALNEPLVIELDQGIADDFSVDLGWEVESTASRGGWVREVPVGTIFNGKDLNPPVDSDDPGGECYLTGNGIGPAGAFDLDEGSSWLRSPAFSIKAGLSPALSLNLWYQVASGTPGNDTLKVYLENQAGQLVLLEEYVDPWDGWRPFRYDLSAFPDGNYRCVVVANDLAGQGLGNLVEAGVDNFSVEHAMVVTSVPEIWMASLDWQAYPNPVRDKLVIRYQLHHAEGPVVFQLMNMQGQVILERQVSDNEELFLPDVVTGGVYFGVLLGPGFSSQARKLIVQR
ncbi:MAG: choice-of-anchor B family protein [Saprospiraceae bacterium]|nr:choice-of-anchor B family protein [Saprospiraceae bacterium]